MMYNTCYGVGMEIKWDACWVLNTVLGIVNAQQMSLVFNVVNCPFHTLLFLWDTDFRIICHYYYFSLKILLSCSTILIGWKVYLLPQFAWGYHPKWYLINGTFWTLPSPFQLLRIDTSVANLLQTHMQQNGHFFSKYFPWIIIIKIQWPISQLNWRGSSISAISI